MDETDFNCDSPNSFTWSWNISLDASIVRVLLFPSVFFPTISPMSQSSIGAIVISPMSQSSIGAILISFLIAFLQEQHVFGPFQRVPGTTTNQTRWAPGSAAGAAAGPFAGPLLPFLGEPYVNTPCCVVVWVVVWVIACDNHGYWETTRAECCLWQGPNGPKERLK